MMEQRQGERDAQEDKMSGDKGEIKGDGMNDGIGSTSPMLLLLLLKTSTNQFASSLLWTSSLGDHSIHTALPISYQSNLEKSDAL